MEVALLGTLKYSGGPRERMSIPLSADMRRRRISTSSQLSVLAQRLNDRLAQDGTSPVRRDSSEVAEVDLVVVASHS